MKRFTVLLTMLVCFSGVAVAHDAHKGVMNVELGLAFVDGQKVTINYRALNLGSGSTWTKLKSGELGRPYPIAELTTTAELKAGMASVPAGTHRLFFFADKQGKQFLQIGGDRQNAGPRVPLSVSPAPGAAEHLIITATHGDGEADFQVILVYGSSMGTVLLDVK